MQEAEDQQSGCGDRQHDRDSDELAPGPGRDGFVRVDIFGPFDPFRCHFKRPGPNQRHWKTQDQEQHQEAYRPLRDLEEWKDLRRDLNQQPRQNGVRDRHFVNIPPLQFGEERFHALVRAARPA